jgi:mRNA interferase MazF
MNEGEVLLARIQQADGQMKTRPVLLLRIVPPFSDLMVCMVSSQLRHECPSVDEIVRDNDDDFQSSGLKVSSLIRIAVVATLPRKASLGTLGRISDARLKRIRACLAQFIEAKEGGAEQVAAAQPATPL